MQSQELHGWRNWPAASGGLGTSIKEQDARRLARTAQVVFVPDNDEAGEAAAARWREAVGHGAVLRLPDGMGDVNDLAQQPDGEAGFHRLVKALLSDPGDGWYHHTRVQLRVAPP